MNDYQTGRKVFFLYPHSVIESDLMYDLIKNEYEVYTIKDHRKLNLIFKKYKNSILFVNIDYYLTDSQWYEYIKELIEDPEYKSLQIGVLTYNDNTDLAKKYLLELLIPCGFILLKLGKEESRNIILQTLAVNECKGEKKYIRVKSNSCLKSTLNFKHFGELIHGHITDISSVGMGCVLDESVDINRNTFLQKMQLKLNGRMILTDGIVFGYRTISETEKLYVVMFTNTMCDDTKLKIHKYIYEVLQEEMDLEVNQMYEHKIIRVLD